MSMFAWVVVDVIDMPIEIRLVADAVFPITALPDAAFVLALSAGGYALAVGQGAGKASFDQAPAQGEIGITSGQGS